jgi:flavin-binding protein dodecin
MAKKTAGGVYRVTEIIGTSKTSWEEAAANAVKTAATSLRDLRVAEVEKLDLKVPRAAFALVQIRELDLTEGVLVELPRGVLAGDVVRIAPDIEEDVFP